MEITVLQIKGVLHSNVSTVQINPAAQQSIGQLYNPVTREEAEYCRQSTCTAQHL